MKSPLQSHPPRHGPAERIVADAPDVDFIDAGEDRNCVDGLVTIAQRCARASEDEINSTEASEERVAAAEGLAQR